MKKKISKKNRLSKKIWIDLDNSPHVVFFKPIIDELNKRGYKTVITLRDCSQTIGLADLIGLNYRKIGRHYGKSRVMKIVGLFLRAIQLVPLVFRERPELALSHGSRSQLLLAALFNIPSILIDDYEYSKYPPFLKPRMVLVPEVIPDKNIGLSSQNIRKYPGIKEDVYIPKFRPDPGILNALGLSKNDLLVTIRPPATEAHYHNPHSESLFESLVEYIGYNPETIMIILPRNEKQASALKKRWSRWCANRKIVIPHKVVNGLNLMWHSDFVISGGGTMNREAAALGVPVYSIFRGKIGAVDRYLADTGRLTFLENVEDIRTKMRITRRERKAKVGQVTYKTLQCIVDEIAFFIEQK